MRNSSDYIPYDCEIEAARATAAARIKDKPDPRHEYVVSCKLNGSIAYEERVFALTAKDAEALLRQQFGLVGVSVQNVTVVQA